MLVYYTISIGKYSFYKSLLFTSQQTITSPKTECPLSMFAETVRLTVFKEKNK